MILINNNTNIKSLVDPPPLPELLGLIVSEIADLLESNGNASLESFTPSPSSSESALLPIPSASASVSNDSVGSNEKAS